jgi:hypothetical protein
MASEDDIGAGTAAGGGQETGAGDGGAGDKAGKPGGETLMTSGTGGGGAGDKAGGGDGAGDKAGDADPSAEVPDKPEGYDLKFSAETVVDKELLSGFRKAAHEMGISVGQARKLAALYEGHAAQGAEKARAEQARFLLEARRGWEAEIQKSPSFEADRANIQAALRRFGDPELYGLLDQTNLGSHPRMWAFMAAVGRALAEPGFRGGNAGGEKSIAETLYPNMN